MLSDSGVDDAPGSRPDVYAGAIPFDEGDDGLVRDPELASGPIVILLGMARQPTSAPRLTNNGVSGGAGSHFLLCASSSLCLVLSGAHPQCWRTMAAVRIP